MNVSIINSNFSDINSVRYYSGPFTLVQTLIKADTTGLNDSDFIETDFKYIQSKEEFLNPDILNELERGDQTNINGLGLEGVKKFYSTLFPTIIYGVDPGGGTVDKISYFSSSIDVDGTETFCFLVPEGVTSILLYSDLSDNIRSRCISISFDTSSSRDEIGPKILYLVVSYSPDSPRILNLSWKAYHGDKNPNRVMSDYVLRNDSNVSNWKGYQEKNGYLYSGISSSLIGTEKVVNRPVYNLLKGFIGEEWSRSKRYSIGDTAKIGSTIYESLESNNIGNHPYYSKMWVIKS